MTDKPYSSDSADFYCRRDRVFTLSKKRPLVMGILNITPDSFSDGGNYLGKKEATAQAIAMQSAGADCLDIGGESTRPDAEPIDAKTEWNRLEPVLSHLSTMISLPLSIDTYKAEVAAKAIRAGCSLVNDIWGLQKDPDMAPLIAEKKAGVVIMHNRATLDPDLDIVTDIENFFHRSLAIASAAGIDRRLIILDPGIGFGKTYEQNFTVLHHLPRLNHFNLPILIGLSRKRFIGRLLTKEKDDRLHGTLAANLFAINRGARLVRVHDVAPHVEALTMFEALNRGQPDGQT